MFFVVVLLILVVAGGVWYFKNAAKVKADIAAVKDTADKVKNDVSNTKL